MTTPLQDLRRMDPDLAEYLIQVFGDMFGAPTLYFAWHAAFPMVLTPDLLYRMWVNFQLDSLGRPLDIPWVAVADLLLSDLVRPVGHEIYEMDGTARDLLLVKLRRQADPSVFPCFGPSRLDRLSAFLLEYITPQLNAHNQYTRQRAQAQQLVTQAQREPQAALVNLARQITESIQQGDFSAQLRLSAIVEMLSAILAEQAGYSELRDYTRKRADLVQGATRPPDQAAIQPVEPTKTGVELPDLATNLPETSPAMQVTSLINQAAAALQAARYPEVQGLLDQARQLQPDDPRLAPLEAQLAQALAAQRVKGWLDFKIRLVQTSGSLDIQVSSPAGEALLPIQQALTGPDLAEFDQLTARFEAQAPVPDLLREWGERLYQAVIWEGCRDIYQRSLDIARQSDNGLRILFDLTEAPRLQRLPWEYLFDPEQEQFLALANRLMIHRFIPVTRSFKVETPQGPPTRLLALTYTPEDLPGNQGMQWRLVRELLEPAIRDGRADLLELSPGRSSSGLDVIRDSMTRHKPHILFIIGPGQSSASSTPGDRASSAYNRQTSWFQAEEFAQTIQRHLPALAVFCTDQGRRADPDDPSVDLPLNWLKGGAPAVVAPQYAASAGGSQAMLVALCRALLAGAPLDVAFADARRTMAAQGYFEWGAYTLYTSQRQFAPLFFAQPAVKESPQKPPSQPAFAPRPGWTLGIDASEFQGEVDWRQVAQDPAGVHFVILRATRGTDQQDQRFNKNWQAAAEAGLLRGAYHVYRFSQDPLRQANFFYKIAGHRLETGDLPPVVDVEPEPPSQAAKKTDPGSPAKRTADLQRFLERVERQTARKPIIYTNANTWKTLLGDSDAFSGCPLWVAHYNVDQPPVPANDWGGQGWRFWQFRQGVPLQGASKSNNFDLTWFQGSLESLQQWLAPAGSTPGTRDDFRILSLDGGGVRVALTLMLLDRLAEGHPGFLDEIDLFAGTSSGALVALGLAAGFSPARLSDFVSQALASAFTNNLSEQMTNPESKAPYSSERLEESLLGFLGSQPLASLKKPVLLTAIDLHRQRQGSRRWKGTFFRNYWGDPDKAKMPVSEVALRVLATPAYFPSVGGYVDGSCFAPNPAMCALAEALSGLRGTRPEIRLADIRLLSIGAGRSMTYVTAQDENWGLSQWSPYLAPLLQAGEIPLVDYQCRALLGKHYLRLDPTLPENVAWDAIDQLPDLRKLGFKPDLSQAMQWLEQFIPAPSRQAAA